MQKLSCFGVAAAALLNISGASADIVIDDFTSGPGVFSEEPYTFGLPFPQGVVQPGLDRRRVLNGTRFIGINGVQFGTGTITATIDPTRDGGRFDYDASQVVGLPDFSYGLIETMSVGAGDPNWEDPSSTFSVDLTVGGNDRLEIDILQTYFPTPLYEEQPFTVFVNTSEPTGVWWRDSAELVFTLGSAQQAQTVVLPFSDAPDFDFSRVAFVEVWTPNLADGVTISLSEVRAAGGGPLSGDYNGDGFVSQADLDLVLLNWGDNACPWNAFCLHDDTSPFAGQVSQNELDAVLLNWGEGNPPVLAVPEPATGLLTMGGTLLLVCRRRLDTV